MLGTSQGICIEMVRHWHFMGLNLLCGVETYRENEPRYLGLECGEFKSRLISSLRVLISALDFLSFSPPSDE